MSDAPRIPPRTPADQLRALGYETARGPVDDTPRWHLEAAGEALEDGRLEDAEEALARAMEGLAPGAREAEAASELALRLARLRGDPASTHPGPGSATAGRGAGEEGPPTSVRGADGHAASVIPASLDPSPRAPHAGERSAGADGWEIDAGEIPDVPLPSTGLPVLPEEEEGDDPWEGAPASPGGRADEVLAVGTAPWTALDEPPGVPLPGGETPARLRERLVEQLLRTEDAAALFATATTLLRCGHHADAEVLFAAAAETPELRVAAWEGVMEVLVRSGRPAEAASTGARLERLFRDRAHALAGIRRWRAAAEARLSLPASGTPAC